jgi:hypothetical protein
VDAAELEVHRSNTRYFISVNPTSLVLIPRTRVISSTGVTLVDGAPRAAQIVRLIDQSSTSGPQPGEARASDGKQRTVQYQLLGEHDAVWGLYDHWRDAQGVHWEIADMIPDNGYERRARVVRYGES